jgi:hypothetical protein
LESVERYVDGEKFGERKALRCRGAGYGRVSREEEEELEVEVGEWESPSCGWRISA